MKLEEVLEIIKRNTSHFFPEGEFIEKYQNYLKTGKPIRIKYGADPSKPDLHLGHYVSLKKLRDLQEIGFEVVIIIGDFTATIGDPTGRSKTRPRLSREEVMQNAKTYINQLSKVLDINKISVRYNSEWLSKLSAYDIVELSSKYTISRMLEREDFKNRINSNEPLFIHEVLYPLFQAYDSVYIDADIEVGGEDQLFNFTLTREIQKQYGKEPQVVLTLPLLIGTDGKLKMSKSYNNYIAFNDEPFDMFGKIMSIGDNLILDYYKLVLYEYNQELENFVNENPRVAKEELAYRIVKIFHGEEIASKVREEFNKVFKYKEIPEDTQVYQLMQEEKLSDILIKTSLVSSKNECRRLLSQNAIKIDNKVVNQDIVINKSVFVRIGKHRFLKIVKL
ncbi:MAG: tyrosine--tRNA ligase [candidate division WOR-3 bacterium]|nr:tyrosine--tRNA ligase [candidate division WOR-3 bacterium]MDW8150399.1 tyrosine--tRNA ligase [candidate division WOR-3 bacterium]